MNQSNSSNPLPGNPGPGGPPPSGGSGNSPTTTVMQRNLALYGYIFLFLFGYFGHINTMIIFLRPTLRSISTSFLFICVTLSNIIYISICIYDFLYIGIGLSSVSLQTNSNLSNRLCRFRSFIQSFAMCSSAWFLLSISVDRWIRIRFPFQIRKLCTIKRILLVPLIIIICAVLLNCHLLLPSLGSLTTTICGPVTNDMYSFFFRQVWSILLTCLQTVLPTILLLIITIDMFIRLRIQQKQKQRLNRGGGGRRRRSFIDRQILIIMLTSIFIFFSTQIPLSLFNILLSPVLNSRLSMTQALELTSILTFIASINYATTFYVHCLTSGLFRKEFYNVFISCFWRHHRRIGVVTQMIGQTTQTQMELRRRQGKRIQEDCSIETIP